MWETARSGLREGGSRSKASTEEAKRIICELLAAAGGVFQGKLRLNKAFYFAHLYYWREADGVLSDYPIVRLPMGPCIDDLNVLLRELAVERRISVSVAPVGPYEVNVYKLETQVDFEPHTERGRAIREAVAFVGDKTSAELSEITHEFSRSWQSTPDGREMDIYSDLLPDENLAAIRQAVAAVRAHDERLGAAH